MPAFRSDRPLHERFLFRVAIGGVDSAEFARCSELSYEVEKIDYREGGALIPLKVPGLVSFTDVTLERGSSDNQDLYAWALQVANAASDGGSGAGLADPTFKRHLTINQLRRDKRVTQGWTLYFAWPTKFVAGEWDNGASEVRIESLTLTFDYFERVDGEVAAAVVA